MLTVPHWQHQLEKGLCFKVKWANQAFLTNWIYLLCVSVVTLVILIESLDEEKFKSHLTSWPLNTAFFYKGLFVFISGWVKSFVMDCWSQEDCWIGSIIWIWQLKLMKLQKPQMLTMTSAITREALIWDLSASHRMISLSVKF